MGCVSRLGGASEGSKPGVSGFLDLGLEWEQQASGLGLSSLGQQRLGFGRECGAQLGGFTGVLTHSSPIFWGTDLPTTE